MCLRRQVMGCEDCRQYSMDNPFCDQEINNEDEE